MKPIFIKDFFPAEILTLLHNYAILKYSNHKKYNPEKYAHSLIGEYADPLMETILDMSTPVIEQNVQKKLWPTYSFLRIYDKCSDLPVHNDRKGCEYTVAICIGCDPIDKPYNIYIGKRDENSDYKYRTNTGTIEPLKIEHRFSMLPNNALLFQGQDEGDLHWREECTHDYYTTLFIHYVDQEGDQKEHKYDRRPMLCSPAVVV